MATITTNDHSGGSRTQRMLNTINILRTEDLAVDFYPSAESPQKIVAVTFTPFSPFGDGILDTAGYATDFLVQHGFDVVAVKSARNAWYQNLSNEMLETIERFIRERAPGYTKRVAYGSSMGAYAAIQFSNALRIDTVLALSPQFEIDGAFDTRWAFAATDLDVRHRISATTLATTCKYFVVYDPATLDELHVERLRQLLSEEQLIEVETPFSGHPSAYYLAETGLLKDLAVSVLGESSIENIDLISPRHQSKTYLYELSKSLHAKGKNESALSAVERAIAMDETVAEFHLQRAEVLKKLIRKDDALHAANTARRLTSNPDLLAALANLFAGLNQSAPALDAIDAAIGYAQSRVDFVRLKIEICEKFSLLRIAVETVEELLNRLPRDRKVILYAIRLNLRCISFTHTKRACSLALSLLTG